MKLFYKVLVIGFPFVLLYTFSNRILYSQATDSVNDRSAQHRLAGADQNQEDDGLYVTNDLKPSVETEEDAADAPVLPAVHDQGDSRPKEAASQTTNDNQLKPKIDDKLLGRAELLVEDNKKKQFYGELNEALKKKPEPKKVNESPSSPDQKSKDTNLSPIKVNASQLENGKPVLNDSLAEIKTPNVPVTRQTEDKDKTNQINEKAKVNLNNYQEYNQSSDAEKGASLGLSDIPIKESATQESTDTNQQDQNPESRRQDVSEHKPAVNNITANDTNFNLSDLASRKKRELYEKQTERNSLFSELPGLQKLLPISEAHLEGNLNVNTTALESLVHNDPPQYHDVKDGVNDVSLAQPDYVDNAKRKWASQKDQASNMPYPEFPEFCKLLTNSIKENKTDVHVDKNTIANESLTNISQMDRLNEVTENQPNNFIVNNHELHLKDTDTSTGSYPGLFNLRQRLLIPEESKDQINKSLNPGLLDIIKSSPIAEEPYSQTSKSSNSAPLDLPQLISTTVDQNTQTFGSSNPALPDLPKLPLTPELSNAPNLNPVLLNFSKATLLPEEPTAKQNDNLITGSPNLQNLPSTLQELNRNFDTKVTESEQVTNKDSQHRSDSDSLSNDRESLRHKTVIMGSSNSRYPYFQKPILRPEYLKTRTKNCSTPGLPGHPNLPSVHKKTKCLYCKC